jgi:hypothetical protein
MFTKVIYELSLFDKDLDIILKKYRAQKHEMAELLNESPETSKLQQQINTPTIIFITRHEPAFNHDIRRFRHMRLRFRPQRFGQVHHYRLVKKLQQHQRPEQTPVKFSDYMRESIKQKFRRYFNVMHEKAISEDLVKGVVPAKVEKEQIWNRPSNVSGQAQKVLRVDALKRMGDTGDLKAETEKRNKKLEKWFNPVPFSISEEAKKNIEQRMENEVFKKNAAPIVNSNYEYVLDKITGEYRPRTTDDRLEHEQNTAEKRMNLIEADKKNAAPIVNSNYEYDVSKNEARAEKAVNQEESEDEESVDEDSDDEEEDVGEIGTPFMKDD